MFVACVASDRSVQQSIGDAREALITAAVDMLKAFGSTLVSSQRVGQLPCPRSLRLIPLYILALTKHVSGLPRELWFVSYSLYAGSC